MVSFMPDPYRERLIVFTRYPDPGKTKTRLIPLLGPTGAAALQREMTEHTLSQLDALRASRGITVEIRFEGGDEALMRDWLGADLVYRPQTGDDLGTRMSICIEESFAMGDDVSIIIGTDIPGISDTIVEEAFDLLKEMDIVLGPAQDGGYYLIGLRRSVGRQAVTELFSGIEWGSDTVFENTMRIAARLGLASFQVAALADVDRPEDMPLWERYRRVRKENASAAGISVIIPAINEASRIGESLQSVRHGRCEEVILVDGGSRDDTVAIAKSMGAKVIAAAPPRAHQLNAGARDAVGDALLFLHADTRLPESYDEPIMGCLEKPGTVCGAFRLRIDSPRKELRIVESLADFRSICLRTPYGDQAIFMRAELFHRIGGFPAMPIMEDFELMRRLRKKGKIRTLPQAVLTCSRRWDNLGVIRTTLTNQLIIGAYLLGTSPERIARWYRRDKGVR